MNDFAELSDGDSAKFLVRWRGRQEGPYLASVIQAKLAANEIGLLHEIFCDGKWVTIRDYISEREAILRAELQAREEQERKARQEAEGQAKEREEKRQTELLAEEKRRNAQVKSQEEIEQQRKRLEAERGTGLMPTTDRGLSSLQRIGALLLIGGLIVAGYFFLAFDTSVESGVGRVNNLGLMADRQDGIIIGIGLGIVGTIMLAIGFRGKN
jgi:hypothetical protein